MKNLLRTITLALVVSIAATFYLANPFAQSASAAGCWYGCTDGPQRNRSGCSVVFRGCVGDNCEFGRYEYTCGNNVINCFYKYNCDSGGGDGDGGGDRPPILD